MATTTHWLPNFDAALAISSGSLTAAELMDILSAPALSISLKSSMPLMPPPTVKGINTFSAVLRTTSIIVFRPSWVAVISRNTISSAPSLL